MLVNPYTPLDGSTLCSCASQQLFSNCCQPLIEGRQQATSAEQLMRSRYSAHATGHISYIVDTWAEQQRSQLDVAAIAKWATQSQWLGLQVIACEQGLANDSSGTVEFVATFKSDGQLQLHREVSQFIRSDGRWYFLNTE